MPRRYADNFPQRVNMRVPAMAYTAGIEGDDIIVNEFIGLAAANNNGILSFHPIAVAGSTTVFVPTFVQSNAQMSRWGRGLQFAASGAATSTVLVTGRDYLGQRMQEQITLNGVTAVAGVKAFRYVDRIDWAAAPGAALFVGWSNVLGLKCKIKQSISEIKNNNPTAHAGIFTNALANNVVSTLTNADVRGTYTPVVIVPDGNNVFEVRYVADTSNLHGNRHFAV